MLSAPGPFTMFRAALIAGHGSIDEPALRTQEVNAKSQDASRHHAHVNHAALSMCDKQCFIEKMANAGHTSALTEYRFVQLIPQWRSILANQMLPPMFTE